MVDLFFLYEMYSLKFCIQNSFIQAKAMREDSTITFSNIIIRSVGQWAKQIHTHTHTHSMHRRRHTFFPFIQLIILSHLSVCSCKLKKKEKKIEFAQEYFIFFSKVCLFMDFSFLFFVLNLLWMNYNMMKIIRRNLNFENKKQKSWI